MSAQHMYGLLSHFSQMAFAWLESQYGTAKMGLFVLSYGCTKQQWDQQIDTLESLHAWLGALLPVVKIKEPHMWGCLYQLHLQEQKVNEMLRVIDWSLPEETEEPEYPTLHDNPANWFLD